MTMGCIGIIVGIFASIAVVIIIVDTSKALANPDWYAIQLLISQFKAK